MEIQGPNDTKDTKCQHGAPVNTPVSQCEPALEARRRILKPNLSLSLGSESDKLNKRSRSTPLRIGENGSVCDRPLRNNRCEKSDVPSANAELSDVAVFKQNIFRESESLPSELDELKEHELVMAIPYTDPVNLEQRHPPEKVPSPEELYVVFNIVHNDEDKRHSAFQPKAEAGGVSSPPKSNIGHTASSLEERNPSRSQLSTQSVSRRCHQNGSLETEQQEPLLSDGYSEASQTPKLPGVEMKDHVDPPEEFLQCVSSSSSAFMPENRADDELNITGQEVTGNVDGIPEAAPISVHEAFSGTIMINNQSIVVTIENGVLTLASSPEGYVYKDDGMMSSKEQSGICEDQVLLNQDGGTKSDRKVSNVTQDEPKSQLLTLTDNCSLSEMAVSSAIKREGITGSVETVNGVCQPGTSKVQKNPLAGYSKKNSVVKFACPQPGCSCTFDSRQNLKIHVVLHTGSQRPFKCTVKGCDWSFTTSYKLKRHLQSHEQVRPFQCGWENCGRRFTTIYNLKAHVRVHDQENSFVCEVCNERFRTATRLTNHQRTHFEPERPHKCEFPGCEKTFITFSALFSHNRTHFREMAQFTCTFPGCEKRYDKACRLKIHLRSHTGERPFVCDSDACGWTFTSMSKLLRHKRKHDDDRRFSCPEEGCGKSFTRAEHLKGHSITHLGTKPFECPVESCNAKFSARSSLYIHSKKHKQDGVSLRSRCPVAGCTKHFLSRSSLKTHMLKHHNLSPDVLNQLDCAATLTPSSELTSTSQQVAASPGPVAPDLAGLDLSTLFSGIPTCPGATVSVAGEGGSVAASFSMDMHLVNTGIITIDPTLVEPALGVAKPVEPLILTAGHVLDAAGAGGVLPHATLHLDDVQTVNPDELGTLTALTVRSSASSEHDHSPLTSESSVVSALAPPLSSTMSYPGAPVPELQPSQEKAEHLAAESPVGSLMSRMEIMAQADSSKEPFAFPCGGPKDGALASVSSCSVTGSGGSARTDYRAIQLAKKRKQKSPAAESGLRKTKVAKAISSPFGDGSTAAEGSADLVTGSRFVQIQLLQDDPAADGDLAFQLTSQTSCSHSQLTVDLPVNILQEPNVMAEEENGSEDSQFTSSTINLQDLE